jgi:hypothetical protein
VHVRFYIDPETGRAHVENHGVTEQEVADVMRRPLEDRTGHDGARVAIGTTSAGRFLRVIYVLDPAPKSIFVITAYALSQRARQALRRRRRKKQ